jgi:hypothetical protein
MWDARKPSPQLERLVARASASVRVADWRADAFRVIAPGEKTMPPIVATALHASGGSPPGAWGFIATPVYFSAGMSGVTMPEGGLLELRPDEAAALASDFNRTFVDAGARLSVGRSSVLVCVFDRALEVTTHDPEAVVGHDVFGFQPAGIDAPRLRLLMSEIEMWLFDHAVNRTRTGDGRHTVTGLWLWGGGSTNSMIPAVLGWTAGADPFFAAFGQAQRFPPEAGPGVVVCTDQPGSDTWSDVEQQWLTPAMAALQSGRIKRLDLSAAGRRFSLGRGAALRFWRRPRPWWESFEIKGDESHDIEG